MRGLINAAKLLEEELPPVRWAVPDLVPEGVTLLAGKPKTGKSWLALGLCIATASGGLALGAKRVEEGSTLYLALEDNKPRLQRRLRKLGAEGHRVRGLGMATRWPRIGKGCEEALEEWLAYSPDARLVVIDTLAKIRPPASGNNPYAEDYRALEPLLPIAARHNVAIVVVHHLRKAGADDPLDEISGSTGLSGGTDGALIRKRDRGRADAYVYVTGRDIEEEKEYALRWGQDVPGWTLVGTADEYKATQEQREVLDLLMATGEPMSPSRVSEELASKGIERSPDACRKLLGNLVRDDLATSPGHGKYASVAPNAPSAPNDAGPDNSPDHLGKDATSVTDAKVLDLQVKRSERSVRSDDTWTDPHDRDRAV